MDNSRAGEGSSSDLRDCLAEERTFLAWIRTGIALIGLGFLTARFGLPADGPGLTQQASSVEYAFAFWFGMVLILMGVAVNLFSARRHMRLTKGSGLGQFKLRFPSLEAVAVALLLALLGIAMTICLILAPLQVLAAAHA
jgi:putative membrane protein